MRLLRKDDEHGYRLFQSDLVANNQKEFVTQAYWAMERFNTICPGQSSTDNYRIYNSFALSAGFPLFHALYGELTTVMRNFARKRPLWFQSWINFHTEEQVLDWHDHSGCTCHGFISIQPFHTKTIFEGFEIVNRPGLLYIGPGSKKHKVVVLSNFNSPRVTLAFDVFTEEDMKKVIDVNRNDVNLAIIPIE